VGGSFDQSVLLWVFALFCPQGVHFLGGVKKFSPQNLETVKERWSARFFPHTKALKSPRIFRRSRNDFQSRFRVLSNMKTSQTQWGWTKESERDGESETKDRSEQARRVERKMEREQKKSNSGPPTADGAEGVCTGLSGWWVHVVLLCFIHQRVRKIRNKASSCAGIFSKTFRFHYVARSPSSPLPHLLNGHRELVGYSAIPTSSCAGPVQYPGEVS